MTTYTTDTWLDRELTEEESLNISPEILYKLLAYIAQREAKCMEEVEALTPDKSNVIIVKATQGALCIELLDKVKEFILEAHGKNDDKPK